MACLFGHKWNGCKCEKCGKIRDSNHIYVKIPKECKSKCTVCGSMRNDEHDFTATDKRELICKECGTKVIDLSNYSSLQIKNLEKAIRDSIVLSFSENASVYGISIADGDKAQLIQSLVNIENNLVTDNELTLIIETLKDLVGAYNKQLEFKKIAGTLDSDEAKYMQSAIEIYTDLTSR